MSAMSAKTHSGQGAKRILQEPLNSHRLLVDAVKSCAEERGLSFASYSQGWILELSNTSKKRLVYGYDFGLNRSAIFQMMNDKAGFCDACIREGLPAVPHKVFLHPRLQGYVPGDGNWPAIREAFESWGNDVVVKNNAGTGGKEVTRVQSIRALEQATFSLFQVSRSICLSPFLPLQREVRVVTVNGQSLLAYEKERTTLLGDGRSPLSSLIAEAGLDVAHAATEPVDFLTGSSVNLFDVPNAGQAILLDWRHNLGQGAVPVLIDLKDDHPALRLAEKIQSVLDLKMASIDLVETSSGWYVLEANSGVMLEHLSQVLDSDGLYAKTIYGAALDALFMSI